MPYHIRTEQVEPQPIAVVRFRARRDELSTVIPAACGEVWNFIRAAKLDRPGRHVAVYLDGEINIECGAEVAGPFAGNGRVVYSTTPSGKVVTTTHIGPYARLGEAHMAVREWLADNNLPAGVNWEIYGHWTDDPTQLRTDVYYLIG